MIATKESTHLHGLKKFSKRKTNIYFIVFSLESRCNYIGSSCSIVTFISIDMWAPHVVSLTLGMSQSERNMRGYAHRRQSKGG
mgnify:CR=1 FL=1